MSFARRPGNRELRCRICGCTTAHACPGGCWWVDRDLCSRCAIPLDGHSFKALIEAASATVIAETELGKTSTTTRGRSRQAFRRAWRTQHPAHFDMVNALRLATIGAMVAGGVVRGRRVAERLLP
jgi:hypothetical protein